jgi:putative membrane protein
MKIIWGILAGIFELFLAEKFVTGVSIKIIPGQSVFFGFVLTQQWQILLVIGSILGLINSLLKPILDKITWPLKILTLGLFSLVLNMAIVWFLDLIFSELVIAGFIPLFWTTVIVALGNLLLGVK